MEQTSAPADTDAPGWRYKAGLILFALAVVSPAFAPLVAFTDLSTEWKAIIAGATPNDTVSAIESYSAPKRLSEWVSRAARPSRMSKMPATRIA